MQGDERSGNGGERQGTRREEDGKEERQKKWVTQSTGGPEKGRRRREKGTWMGRMGRMETGRRTGGGVGIATGLSSRSDGGS
jgi:hypothetical protein